MTTGRYPDSEIVIAAWIMSIPGINADFVDYQLPWDLNVPVNNGYVQVNAIGGVPNQDVPLFHSTVQVDCWISSPSEDRIYRQEAKDLAKQIQLATYPRSTAPRGVTPVAYNSDGTTTTYPVARVFGVYCLSEPHYIDNTANPVFEGMSMDLMFSWTFDYVYS